MSDVTIKIIIAGLLLAAGTAAFLTMMTLMGKQERPGDPAKLRKAHRTFGYIYLALLVPLVYFGARLVGAGGDGLPVRAVFHVVLAETLIALALLKFLVVRFFRGFLKNAQALGMALFTLTLVVFLITAGFVFLQKLGG